MINKNILLYGPRYRIGQLLAILSMKVCKKKLNIDYDNAVIFMLACDYNNVGDILIRIAQEEFLKNNTNNRQIITINYSETDRYLEDIRKNATENTIIALTGGGDVDDTYTRIERARNRIINVLRPNKCKIISFPQTISYSNTKKGKYYLRRAQKTYKNNKNLVFVAREKKSYDFAIESFTQTKILLTPDIVLSHDASERPLRREGIGMLIRNDVEKKISDLFLNKIIKRLEKKYSVTKNDMTVPVFNKCKIYDYAKEKIEYAKSKKLIITDRLHGMVLCYITNTPCIVFNNSNHKISETYNNWLKNTQNFIILEDDTSSIEKILNDTRRLMNLKRIEKQSMSEKYEKLKKIFRE